jgi:hypothetical protein
MPEQGFVVMVLSAADAETVELRLRDCAEDDLAAAFTKALADGPLLTSQDVDRLRVSADLPVTVVSPDAPIAHIDTRPGFVTVQGDNLRVTADGLAPERARTRDGTDAEGGLR